MNQCCFQGLHIEPLKINHEFLVGGLILKNMKVSWDDEIPNIWEHNIHVPATTNQNNIGYDGFFIIYPILYVWFIMIWWFINMYHHYNFYITIIYQSTSDSLRTAGPGFQNSWWPSSRRPLRRRRENRRDLYRDLWQLQGRWPRYSMFVIYICHNSMHI